MTTLIFNELLDQEVRDVAQFYAAESQYQPHEYVRVAGDGPEGTAITHVEVLDPGDSDLVTTMRQRGAAVALQNAVLDPLAIFVVQASIGIKLDDSGNVPVPQRVITIYGITNDARYNLAVLQVQEDEDGRLYAVPSDVFYWTGELPAPFVIDVLPFLEFFRINDNLRIPKPTTA